MQQPIHIPQIPFNLICGVSTGVIIAGLFHPWDRALFLSVSNKRPFIYDGIKNTFVLENFAQPYHGFAQTVFSKTISTALYFVAQQQINDSFYPYLHYQLGLYEWQAQLAVGLSVGSITGIGTNGLYAVRSQTWNNSGSTFLSSAKTMWAHGGIQPFTKGISATVGRDAIFSTAYEVLRHCGRKDNKSEDSWQFAQNAGAAGVATLFSGPSNYVRNRQYATAPNLPTPKAVDVLSDIWQESKSQESQPLRLGFFMQRFQIGWGTARVAVGMATGQKIFEELHTALRNER